MEQHSCVRIEPRQTDFIQGVNSPIVFKAVSNGVWTPRLEFFENQDLSFETEGCVLFAAQESFDAQIDNLIAIGTIPDTMVTQFHTMGYMDLGRDGLAHFHSSPRFLQVLTGNGLAGNALHDPWDVMRQYGVLPWLDLPYTAATTQGEYFSPITPPQLSKASSFLSLIGGRNAIQYHWIVDGTKTNLKAMQGALPQAPLCLGTAVCEPWNQLQPPVCNMWTPAHSTMVYTIDSVIRILDHYVPYQKQLPFGYPIPYAMQGIVTVPAVIEQQVIATTATVVQDIATSPATPAQKLNWLQAIALAIKNLFSNQ